MNARAVSQRWTALLPLLASVALAAACADAGTQAAAAPPIDTVRAADAATDPAEAAAQGVVPADFVTPPSWSLPRLDPADEPSWGSLLSTSDAGKQRAFRPVDAVTAFDLPGYAAPYAEERSFRIRAISPDGRLAAVSTLSTPESSSARLHLFRLDSWTTVASSSGTLPLGFLVWSPDGSRLIGTRTTCHGPRPEGRCDRWQRDLVVIPVDGGAVLEPQVLAELDFMIDALWIDPGGDTLYAFAWRSDVCCGIEIEGSSFVAVIDAQSGEIRAEIELPGLLVGQRMEQRGRGIQSVRYGAGLAMAPDGSRLYVAHPDADRVTVIDLEALRVERTVDIEPARSALSRFRSWLFGRFASRAEAKGGLVFTKQAAVTPDGRLLLVTGKGDELHDGEGRVDGVPAGLQVIDTATMRLLRKFEDVREVLMTQDGRYALATGELLDYRSIDANGNARVVGFGAKVIDLQTLEVLAHIEPDVAFISRVLTPDGRFAHLLSRRTDGWDRERCIDGCAVITVVDLERAEIVAERRLDTRWASLTSLVSQR